MQSIMTARVLPVPANLRGLVHGGAGYACALRAAIERGKRAGPNDAAARAMQRLVELIEQEGPAGEAVGELVAAILPRANCRRCGAPYLLYSRRLRYCGNCKPAR